MGMMSIEEIDKEIERLNKEKKLLIEKKYEDLNERYVNKYFSCEYGGFTYYFQVTRYFVRNDIIYLIVDGYSKMFYLIGDKHLTKSNSMKLELNKIYCLLPLTYDEYKNKVNTFLESMKVK